MVLKEIDLPVVENGQCQAALRTTRYHIKSSLLRVWFVLKWGVRMLLGPPGLVGIDYIVGNFEVGTYSN